MAMTQQQITFVQQAAPTLMAAMIQVTGTNQFNFESLAQRAADAANALWNAVAADTGDDTDDPAIPTNSDDSGDGN